MSSHGDFVRRVRSEYLEMPGLQITASEAQRLFGLDEATCDAVLDALVKSGFLTRVNGIFTLAKAGNRDAPPR